MSLESQCVRFSQADGAIVIVQRHQGASGGVWSRKVTYCHTLRTCIVVKDEYDKQQLLYTMEEHMDKPIPTSIHGVLDYLSVPALLALPRLLKWNKNITNLTTGIALGTLGASLMTRYELGVFKIIPMTGHLTLDATNGLMLAASPFVLLSKWERNATVTSILVGLGAFEISAALLTQTQPSTNYRVNETVDKLKDLIPSK